MKTTDDDIRAAFKWPVRYEEESGYIRDSGNHLVLHMCGAYIQSHKMVGEAIAEMLNERYAPKNDRIGVYTQSDSYILEYEQIQSDDRKPMNRFTPKGGGSDANER